jgi:predicted DCC family thiol-disulfide oxidoreductase YuxK
MATLVFDGDCGFCTRSVALMPKSIRRTTTVVPYQRADLAALGLTEAECAEAVQWVADDGTHASGSVACARALQAGSPLLRIAGTLLLIPPLSWLSAALYRLVAANRMHLPGGTPACALPAPPENADLSTSSDTGA